VISASSVSSGKEIFPLQGIGIIGWIFCWGKQRELRERRGNERLAPAHQNMAGIVYLFLENGRLLFGSLRRLGGCMPEQPPKVRDAQQQPYYTQKEKDV
jgi:hypothetical protein